ncbi:Hsp20/alpha crystallin family protein [Ktedonospora formicarum]|uniref:Molecular chaperone n=1 Tax=Ktedonospora formicarum TaxID=2778364 RepID=A0A8J3MUI7_9CHLR|nr:Hsp20/alpha crystallin family protein [Ktedonospora formicarum]GHO46663.1 molecular chaperone [Ktedonospora formicarum]
MSMSRFDPFGEGLSLRNAMNQLFEQSFVRPRLFGESVEAVSMPMDVYEDEHGYEIRVGMPGVKPEDINLTIHQNTLTIRGEYHQRREVTEPQAEAQNQPTQTTSSTQEEHHKQGNWLLREIHSGSFQRTVTLDRPIDVDHVTTNYENGILGIKLPLSEASRPRRINIQRGQETNQPPSVNAAQPPQQPS